MIDLVVDGHTHVGAVETGRTADHGHRLSRAVVASHTDITSTALEEVLNTIDGRDSVVVFNGSSNSGFTRAIVTLSTRG